MARCLRYNTAMINDKRRLWSLLLFIGMFAPVRGGGGDPAAVSDAAGVGGYVAALPTVGALLAKPRSAGAAWGAMRRVRAAGGGGCMICGWRIRLSWMPAESRCCGKVSGAASGGEFGSGRWRHMKGMRSGRRLYIRGGVAAGGGEPVFGGCRLCSMRGNVEMFSIDDKTIGEPAGDACGEGGDRVGCGAVCNHAREPVATATRPRSADAGCFVFAVDDAAGVFALRWRGGDGHGGGNHDAGDSAATVPSFF